MAKYDLTQKQMAMLRKDGYVSITRNGVPIRVTPSMVSNVTLGGRSAQHFDEEYSYTSGKRPVLVIEFNEYRTFGFGSEKRKILEFSASQRENYKEKWVEWGHFGVNFYFTTNKGKSWKDSIKYAKAWVTRNLKKDGSVKNVSIRWETA